MDAMIATAQVKRARFAFTIVTSSRAASSGRQPGCLGVALPKPQDPWLCVPASRRVCPGRSIWRRTSVVLNTNPKVLFDRSERPTGTVQRRRSGEFPGRTGAQPGRGPGTR